MSERLKKKFTVRGRGGWEILTEKNLYKVTVMKGQNVYERNICITGAQNTCKKRAKVKLAMEPDHKKLFY